jgi:uncharacterized protein YkwD
MIRPRARQALLHRAAAGVLLFAGLATFQPLVVLADAGLGPDVTASLPGDVPADVAGAMADAPTASATAPDAAHTATPLEVALFQAVNDDRVQSGLPPLEFDPSLLPVARARADAQRPQPSLNHYDPDGRLAFVKLLAVDNVDYVLAGENLARLPGPDDATVFRAEDALMHSPTHRANILEPTFNRLAIGASFDANGRVIFAQIFRNKAA